MSPTPDPRRILTSTLAELRDYYKELTNNADVDSITAQLLQAVERGLIPPLAFAPWLGVSKSPSVIREALRQRVSISIRKFAIKQLRLTLSSPRWKEAWDGVGGTTGLLDIFSELSVREIFTICRALGRQSGRKQNFEKSECLTELFKGLQPDYFSDAPYKTEDRRPLSKYYALLIPSCSGDFVEKAVESGMEGIWRYARTQDLLQHHPKSIQKELLRSLALIQTQDPLDEQKLKGLVQFPSGTSTMHRFSASMEFSLSVLRQIVKSEIHAVDDDFFINSLVRPLLRRAVKKHVDWGAIQEMSNLTSRYLETHQGARGKLSKKVGDVLHLVAKCWARKPDLFENPLRRLCSQSSHGKTERYDLWVWADFLNGIASTQRYRLLRLCYQESTGLDLDVDTDLERVKGPFSNNLLTNLDYKQAFLLFTRLRRARGDAGLVKSGFPPSASVLYPSSDYEMRMQGWADGIPELYQCYLMNLNGEYQEAEELGAEYIKGRKRKAKSASKPEQRAFHAKPALFASIACGSLSLYKETLEWTRRFIRDPLVMRELYQSSYPQEAVRLLSGISANISMPLTLTELQERVEAANSILEHIFDTMCLALREPSFSRNHWSGVFGLFRDVIGQRIKLTPKITNRLKVSDDELYKCLWGPTIPMLLRVEEKANQEGHERLDANSFRGIYQYTNETALYSNERSTYRFVDRFAEARNELWCRLRPTVYPAVTTLPASFPRGLAIQDLIVPWDPSSLLVDDRTTYLASRVTATLFPDPDAALQLAPLDGESHQAFGRSVDSYITALQLYIPKSCATEERHRRVQKAWNYAVGPLSRGRLTEEEAVRFWRDEKPEYLEEWPPKSVACNMPPTWPLIPATDSPHEHCEWNPLTSGRPDYPERDLGEPKYMDLSVAMIGQPHGGNTIRETMSMAHPKVPALEERPDSIWDSSRDMGEGGVLSALLYLDAKYVSSDRLLAAPFPSERDARYPILYLDDDFLSREDLSPRHAARGMRGHLDQFPPVLLAQLARSLIKALDAADPDSSTYVTLHEVAMLLIIRLGESDRPALATHLAIDAILDRTKSSSWHRQLLKPALLQKLSASDAQSCIKAFSENIIRIIQENKDKEAATKLHGAPETSSETPFVKITTVKLLTQLLRMPGFFETDFALSVFSTLSEKTSQVDIRLNIVKGLLEILEESACPRQSKDAIAILESTITIAGALDERQPLTEADWAKHEEDQTLPEVQEGVRYPSDDDSPILSALFVHFVNAPNNESELRPFVDRILLPVLERLEENTARWTSLFLRKYGLDEAAQAELEMPPVPRAIRNVTNWVLKADSRLCYLPGTLLEKYMSYFIFVVAPPPSIQALNKRLSDDLSLKSQQDVQTWLRLYGQGLKTLHAFHSVSFISMIGHIEESPNDAGITPRMIQEQYLKLFTTVLWNDTPTYPYLRGNVLGQIQHGGLLAKPWWQPYGKPILEAMVSYIQRLRTQEWERDPNRSPSALPDIFPWRLLLLDYPWPDRTDQPAYCETKCKHFANQLTTFIDEISGSNTPHTGFSHLTSYLAIDAVSSTTDRREYRNGNGRTNPRRFNFSRGKHDPMHDSLMNARVLTAVFLGNITKTRLSWLTAPEIMRVDVAADLVVNPVGREGMKLVDEDLRERWKNTVALWKLCENEGVRRRGWEAEEYRLS